MCRSACVRLGRVHVPGGERDGRERVERRADGPRALQPVDRLPPHARAVDVPRRAVQADRGRRDADRRAAGVAAERQHGRVADARLQRRVLQPRHRRRERSPPLSSSFITPSGSIQK